MDRANIDHAKLDRGVTVWVDLRPVSGDERGLFNGGRCGVGGSEGLIKRQRAAEVGVRRFGGVHFVPQVIQIRRVKIEQVARRGLRLFFLLSSFLCV